MDKCKFLTATALVAALTIPTIANSALVGRLAATEGGTDYQAYYDTEANLTWLADANGAGQDLIWFDANNWVTNLNVSGVSDWRLPNTIDVGNDGITYTNYYQGVDYGYNITAHSELSNLYYNALGNDAYYQVNGVKTGCPEYYCLLNTGPFSNIQLGNYWSGTTYELNSSNTWGFSMKDGLQGVLTNSSQFNTWAVHSGDVATVSAVPIPPSVFLFGSGLLALIGFLRRKFNA